MYRTRLPNRRRHEAFNFDHGGVVYTIGIGFFPDGRPAEFFLNSNKIGTSADVNARDAAVAASLALQHNCPLEVLHHAMVKNPDGSSMGPLGRAIELVLQEK